LQFTIVIDTARSLCATAELLVPSDGRDGPAKRRYTMRDCGRPAGIYLSTCQCQIIHAQTYRSRTSAMPLDGIHVKMLEMLSLTSFVLNSLFELFSQVYEHVRFHSFLCFSFLWWI